MKFIILNLLILLSITLTKSVKTQNSYIKERWNIKVGCFLSPPLILYEKKFNYTFEFNYGISNQLELGTYIGYSPNKIGTSFKTSHSIFYGVNANYHLLPYLLKKEHFRFDIYCSGKIGGNYLDHLLEFPDGFILDKHTVEYGIYAGIVFYLFKHLGIFTETGYGNFIKVRYGVAYKFETKRN